MQTERIYEPGIIKDDAIFFISFLSYIKSFNKSSIDIKQFSYANEKYPFVIIWALEWLHCEDVLNDYIIHSHMSFPEELSEPLRPPASYRRSKDIERLNMVPEHIGRVFNQYPYLLNRSDCSLYLDVNYEKLEDFLSSSSERFKRSGNIKTSELSYKKQLETFINFLRDKYEYTENHLMKIKLDEPCLCEIDIIRAITTLNIEAVPEKSRTIPKYKEKLIEVFDAENKREIWVNGQDEITIYFRLSNYFINEYMLKTNSKQKLFKNIEAKSSNIEEPEEKYEFEGLTLNLTSHTLTYFKESISVSADNGTKLLKILMDKPNHLHQYKDILTNFDIEEGTTNKTITNAYAANVINQGSKSAFPKLKDYLKRVEADKITKQIKTSRGTGLRLESSRNV